MKKLLSKEKTFECDICLSKFTSDEWSIVTEETQWWPIIWCESGNWWIVIWYRKATQKCIKDRCPKCGSVVSIVLDYNIV